MTEALKRRVSKRLVMAPTTAYPMVVLRTWMVMALAGFAVTLMPVLDANAQSRPKIADVNNRLIRVENIIDQSLLDMLQQIDRLQKEIRLLRGEIESQANDINNLQRRNDRLQSQMEAQLLEFDNRMQSIEELGAGGVPPGESDDTDPASQESGSSTSGSGNSGAGSGTDDTSSVDDSSAETDVVIPSDETNNTRLALRKLPDGTVTQSREASAAEKSAYTAVYDLITDEEYEEAIIGFDAFLNLYPDGPLSDNAWYWQGEAMYAQRQFEESIQNFLVVAQSFPASPKVPDARLKIGFALYEQSRFKDSRKALQQIVDDYPGRSASVLARKRLQEMNNAGL